MADNLSRATSRSQHQDRLNQLNGLGQSESDFEDMTTPLQQAAGAFILRVQQNATTAGLSVSGKTLDSLKANIIDEKHSEIVGDPNLFFQDKGVNPSGINLYPNTTFGYTTKAPPLAPLLEWIKAKQIQSRNNAQFGSDVAFEALTEEEQQKQTAYAMRYSIYKVKGIPPKNFMDKEIPQYVADLVELVTAQLTSNVIGQLRFTSPDTPTRGATRFNTPSSPNPLP